MIKRCSKRIGSCLLLILSALSLPLAAADRLEVEIRSPILNIRETISTKSPVIDVLNQGERVIGTTTDHQDWIRLDDGRGFISIHYVNILTRTPVVESPALAEQTPSIAEELTAQPDEVISSEKNTIAQAIIHQESAAACNGKATLNVTGLRKTCRKNLHDMAYEACELAFSLAIEQPCAATEPLSYECSARVFSTGTDNQEYMDELQYQGQISNVAEARLQWYPADTSLRVKEVALREDRCALLF